MPATTQERLSLSNLNEGKLEEEFRNVYPALVAQLKQGQTGTISITIKLKRVPNTDTMVSVETALSPKFPAISRAMVAQIDGEGNLLADKVDRQDNVRQLSLIDKEAEGPF